MSKKTEKQWVEAGDLCLIREITMEICVDGERTGSVSCTPRDLEELATGWLLTEGGVSQVSQIKAININWECSRIEVETNPGEHAKSGPNPQAKPGPNPDTNAVQKVIWRAEDMRTVYALFAVDPPLFRATRAAHSCMILRRRGASAEPNSEQALQALWRSEDAGRHSALDKAIGWAALNGVDLGECMLMTSGRISTRMAAKAGIAGAGALAGRAAVTAEALELAKEYDMALMGYVSAEGAVVFYPGGETGGPANERKDV